jgi:hypothetical protein
LPDQGCHTHSDLVPPSDVARSGGRSTKAAEEASTLVLPAESCRNSARRSVRSAGSHCPRIGTRIHIGRGFVAENTALRLAALGFAGAVGFSSAVAIREQLPAAALGLKISLSVPSGLVVGLGAAIAAPWPMPVAALVASTKARSGNGLRWPSRLCTGLGIAAVLGQLVEPLMRQPKSWTPAVRIALLLNFGASFGLAGAGLWQIKKCRGLRQTKPI